MARLTVGTLLIITAFNLNYSIISWVIDYPGGLVSQVSQFIVGLTTLFLYRRKANKPYFQFRAGIHSGPLVAGIVGIKKFAYDIWGDTVNLAARMEQNGMGGKVNISSQTYELVKQHFRTEPRGKLPAKNKGDIEMYFVYRDMA